MKRLLLMLISFTICSFLYADDLTDKKAEFREQVVKNFKENKIDEDLIIEYAKLFLPKNFAFDDVKMKTPKLSEVNYFWRIWFDLKDEYISDDLFVDGVATVSYMVSVRKSSGEAMLNGWELVRKKINDDYY